MAPREVAHAIDLAHSFAKEAAMHMGASHQNEWDLKQAQTHALVSIAYSLSSMALNEHNLIHSEVFDDTSR